MFVQLNLIEVSTLTKKIPLKLFLGIVFFYHYCVGVVVNAFSESEMNYYLLIFRSKLNITSQFLKKEYFEQSK